VSRFGLLDQNSLRDPPYKARASFSYYGSSGLPSLWSSAEAVPVTQTITHERMSFRIQPSGLRDEDAVGIVPARDLSSLGAVKSAEAEPRRPMRTL
jgi:hypothetical protein